jgi:hypothetical protein
VRQSQTSHDHAALERQGFAGFLPLDGVRPRLNEIPEKPGIYMVVIAPTPSPQFLDRSSAGWFKGQDPTYPVGRLIGKWVPDATVIYIGKAGPKPSRHLRRRIDELLRFGSGEPIGHRGGRALWQLHGVWNALIAWKQVTDQDPRDAERTLIKEFESAFGKPPFANFAN